MGIRLRRLLWALPIAAAPAVVGGATFGPPDVFTTVAYVAAGFPTTLPFGYHVASLEFPGEGTRSPGRLWLFAGTLLVCFLAAGAAFSRLDPTVLWELEQRLQLGAVAGSVAGLFLLAELFVYSGPFDRLYDLFQ